MTFNLTYSAKICGYFLDCYLGIEEVYVDIKLVKITIDIP